MEFFLVMISVPLFLLILLAFALLVLPRYPRQQLARGAPPARYAPGAQDSPREGGTSGANASPSNFVGWGLTLLAYAAFVFAMLNAAKLNKEK